MTRRRAQRRVSAVQIGAVAIVAAAAVIAIVYFGNVQTAPPASTLAPTITQSGHVRGVASAPVTIEEWADFQCPACGQYARTTEPQLLSTYVARGQVRLVFHDFAFLGQESIWAAEAA